MRRLLIVSPYFSPVNTADMHRARIALPGLRAEGWECEVLSVAPESVERPVLEPALEGTYPGDIPVHRVRGLSPRLTRRLGFGSLWIRCGSALRRAGDDLLASGRFDLVFFSTTQFDAFTLGPRWLDRFGVPYVLDYQDPWVNDYYRRTGTRPPGGPVRFWWAQSTARRREPDCVKRAAGIISVSPAYLENLRSRYPTIDPARLLHLPFGASPTDMAIAQEITPAEPLVPRGDGLIRHVYAGRLGPDMRPALRTLFRAFRLHLERDPEAAKKIRFHFLGTSYAPPPLGAPTALPLAEEEGIAAFVHEHPARIPYLEALHWLSTADALLVLGSEDSGYSASKIYPCLLARRPLLAVARPDSPLLPLARLQTGAVAIACSGSDDRDACVQMNDQWFAAKGWKIPPPAQSALPAEHTAANMTRTLAGFFARALG